MSKHGELVFYEKDFDKLHMNCKEGKFDVVKLVTYLKIWSSRLECFVKCVFLIVSQLWI